jgi:hypothetical protein
MGFQLIATSLCNLLLGSISLDVVRSYLSLTSYREYFISLHIIICLHIIFMHYSLHKCNFRPDCVVKPVFK